MQSFTLRTTAAILTFACFASTTSISRATDPAEPPMLSKIPYLNRLFKNVGPITEVPPGYDLVLPNGERIGVEYGDDDCDGDGEPNCKRCNYQESLRVKEQVAWQSLLEMQSNFYEQSQQAAIEVFRQQSEAFQEIASSAARAAAAEAKLEAYKECNERETKLSDDLAKSRAENAILTANLRATEEKLQLALQIKEAELQIAQLKARLAEAEATAKKESATAAPRR